MKLPLQVTFRNMAHSDPLEAVIGDRVAELESFSDDIIACRVMVELPHHHHARGNRCHVRIDLTIPGEEIVVSHDPSTHGGLQDMQKAEQTKETDVDPVHRYARVVIHEAFDAARRQLQDAVRRRRGAVKNHEHAV